MADLNNTIVRGKLRVTEDINANGNITTNGNITGNGSGLTNLNASNIGSGTLSVDRHYSPTTDNNSALNATLSGTAGAYAKDTEYTVLTGVKAQIDAKGHVTGLTYTAQKIKDTNTTYTFNGAVSTIKDSNLTASRALISDNSGKIAVSDVTSAELSYLDGVTSSIQTQLNAKLDAKLRSETALTVDSAAAAASGRVYPVAVDKSGYLSLNVPLAGFEDILKGIKGRTQVEWNALNAGEYGSNSTYNGTTLPPVILESSSGFWNSASGKSLDISFHFTKKERITTLQVKCPPYGGVNSTMTVYYAQKGDAGLTLYKEIATISTADRKAYEFNEEGISADYWVVRFTSSGWVDLRLCSPGGLFTTGLYTNGCHQQIMDRFNGYQPVGNYALKNEIIEKSLTSAKGDMIYASAESTPTRLGIGSNGQFLSIADDIPTWVTPPIQDNLTSTSTTDSLSANQGRVLKELVDSKVNSSDLVELTLTDNGNKRYLIGSGSAGTWSDIGTNSNVYTQSGSLYATYFYGTSDRRLKENIKDLDLNCLDLVNNINLREFSWKADKEHKPTIGAVAQELRQVLPEKYVHEFIGGQETDDEYLSINDSKLVYLLIGAIQEQQKEIERLKAKIDGKIV